MQERRNFQEATVNSTDAAPCVSAGDGGQLCGIPVGYEGVANRTGYYYLPRVGPRTRPGQLLSCLRVQH